MPANNAVTQGNAPITGWTVTGQMETYDQGPNGTTVRGMRVNFTLPSGAGGSVFVPDSQYNPANVRAAIAYRAGQIAEVSNLTG